MTKSLLFLSEKQALSINKLYCSIKHQSKM